jgi:DNA-binding transcriptional MerR regulator
MERGYLTSEEVLKEAEKLGLELAERKLKYYVTLGIIPKPVRSPDNTDRNYDGRVAYFKSDIVQRLRKVKELQDSGFTLPQIKKYFEEALDPALKDFLQSSRGENENSRLDSLVKLLSSDDIKNATRDFRQKIAADPGDKALEKAAVEYYVEVLSRFLGREKAIEYVDEFIVRAPAEEREKKLAPLKKLRAQVIKPDRSVSLTTLLESICTEVEAGSFNSALVLDRLKEIAEKVHIMQARYRDSTQALKEAFDMSRIMRQAFWAYFKALLEIESFIKNGDRAHLARTRFLAARADEMLRVLEELLAGIKQLINLYEDVEKS